MDNDGRYEDTEGPPPLGADPFEAAEVQRLASALDVLDTGRDPGIDSREDSELASLVRTVSALREELASATETPSFESYRERSRAYILHTLESDAIQTGTTYPVYPVEHRGGAPEEPRIARFGEERRQRSNKRRWTALSSIAAAAAALGIVFFANAGGDGNGGADDVLVSQPGIPTNLTALSTEAELARIQQAVGQLQNNASRGKPTDANLLRAVTESTAAVAKMIETKPATISKAAVTTYLETVSTARTVLDTVQPAEGGGGALAAAQVATEGGQLTASRFLENATPAETPSPTPAATPAATSTATPAPTATATATATPAATPTVTPAATPSATAVPAASPEGTVRP